MSTREQCTFDQLDSKSRAESFARHLHNRLRSLSSESDRDGPDDPSWNCDQLSSSSDNDIYYDLDSYPGSPAEEATEDYTGYIGIKYDCTNTSSGTFVNQGNGSSSNGDYLKHSNFSGDCFCLNNSSEDDPTDNNIRIPNFTEINNQNNNYSTTNGTTLPELKENFTKEINGKLPEEKCLLNGDQKLVPSPAIEASDGVFKENCLPENSCTCVNLSNNVKTDLNCNSTVDVSTLSLTNGETSTQSTSEEDKVESSEIVPSSASSNHEEERKESQDVTEDALCRLVDAIFPNSRTNSVQDKHDKPKIKESDNEDDKEEEDTIEIRRAKFRRSSSLKSGKTPPGTPGQKKIVRFADVLGLDLADVRTFLDEIPKVPKSAYEDLQGFEMSSSPVTSSFESSYISQFKKQPVTLVALFVQPSSRPDFLDRVRDNGICLENALVSDMSLFAITGVVRVKNIDFHKSVYIRYSIDCWKTFADLQARYVPSSCDGFSDKFSFLLYAHMLSVGQRLEFAVRYHARGNQYWDNNYGLNYVFQCLQQDNSRYATAGPYVPVNSTLNMDSLASFY